MFKGRIIKIVDAYTLEEVEEKLNITKTEILRFLEIRHYIQYMNNEWYVTILGSESGFVTKLDGVLGITVEGFERLKKAFTLDLSVEQQKQVECLVK